MNDVVVEAFREELAEIKQAGWFDRIHEAVASLSKSGFGTSGVAKGVKGIDKQKELLAKIRQQASPHAYTVR